MATGYEQVRSVAAFLAGDLQAANAVQLVLPETGVCSTNIVTRATHKNPAAAVVLHLWKQTLVAPMTQRRKRLALPDADADSNQNPKQRQMLCNEPVTRANPCRGDVHRANLQLAAPRGRACNHGTSPDTALAP